MQNQQFDHYTIRVTNLKISAEFYSSVLGLKEITNRTEKTHIRWFSLGHGELHLVEGKTPDINTNIGVHLALKLNDFDQFLSHLEESSVITHDSKANPHTMTTRADGVRQVYFKDPDGYWIEVNDAS